MSIFDIDPLYFALGFCGFAAFIALVTVLFVRDGRKVIEPGSVDTGALEGDLTEFVRNLNKN